MSLLEVSSSNFENIIILFSRVLSFLWSISTRMKISMCDMT